MARSLRIPVDDVGAVVLKGLYPPQSSESRPNVGRLNAVGKPGRSLKLDNSAPDIPQLAQ